MKFQHHPDGLIYLEANGESACYPIAWFLIQEPDYRLPEGAISREYIPEQRHSFYSFDNQWGGEMPWEEGDRYLTNQETYRVTWQADNSPPAEPEEPVTQAKWDQFRSQILVHPAYFRIAGHNSQTQVLNSSLVWLMGEIGQNPTILSSVISVWNGIASAAQPTKAEIEALNQVAINAEMPFRLNESGFMVPVSS